MRASLAAGLLAFALAAGIAGAADLPGGGLLRSEPRLLPPEQAFRFSARVLDPTTVEARFDVEPGYYLYRDKLRFALVGNGSAGTPDLPAGIRKKDEFFGDVETYRGQLVVRLPVSGVAPGQVLVVKADSQGCADAGVCYPPTLQQVRLTVPAAGTGPGAPVEAFPKVGGPFR